MWTDSLGYRCCTPPLHLHISSQRRRYPDKMNDGPRLSEAELQETANYLLAGHAVAETAKHFGIHTTTVKHRMHAAGYSYDSRQHCWGME